MFRDPDVIFIGGGPVGLWTAIQLKLYAPSLKIQIFEKYADYQRRHNLNIDASSLSGTHPDPKFQAVIAHFPGYIETNRLEAELLDYAKKLGIAIDIHYVQDCAGLKKEFPTARFIIGSDGRQSAVRAQIFGNELSFNYNLKYIAEVKYKVVGRGRPLEWRQGLSTLAICNHLVVEHVGRERDGETSIALRIFIDQATFDALEGATFKNPAQLDADFLVKCPSLYVSIDTWLSARRRYTNEVIVAAKTSITKVPLDIYQSKKVVKQDDDGVFWLLVGDAAFGLPFFRALNDGLLNGTRLALDIYQQLEDKAPLENYEAYFNRLATYETLLAKAKDLVLTTGISSVASSQEVYGTSSATSSTFGETIAWAWGKINSMLPSFSSMEEQEQTTNPAPSSVSRNTNNSGL